MKGFVTSSLDRVMEWAQSESLWYFQVGGGCCADEMMGTESCKYDLERFGALPQAFPERSDLLIVSTAITEALVPELKKVYEAMPRPRYVMAVGACACSGGAFKREVTYSVIGGLDEILPVDVYVPGCPPRPEAIMNGLIRLQEKIHGSA